MNGKISKMIMLVPLFFISDVTLAKTNALGFKEWKSERVQEALSRVVKIKTYLEVQKRKNEEESASHAFNEVLLGGASSSEKEFIPTDSDLQPEKNLLSRSYETKARILEELRQEQEAPIKSSPTKSKITAPSKVLLKGEMTLEKAEVELARANLILDMVRDFSIKDYFQLYLQQQPDKKEAFIEAASKLTAPEVAELLALMDLSQDPLIIKSGHSLLMTDDLHKKVIK